MDDVLLHKLLALFTVLILITITVCAPIKVARAFNRLGTKGHKVMSALMCFSGGVFLAAFLLHLVPKGKLVLGEAFVNENNIEFPVAELVMAAGFFMVLIIEQIVHRLTHRPEGSTSPLVRQLSVRGSRPVSGEQPSADHQHHLADKVDQLDSPQCSACYAVTNGDISIEMTAAGKELQLQHAAAAASDVANRELQLQPAAAAANANAGKEQQLQPNGSSDTSTTNGSVDADDFGVGAGVTCAGGGAASCTGTTVGGGAVGGVTGGAGDHVTGGGLSAGHSHIHTESQLAVRSVILLIALSMDCIFEGISCGLESTVGGVWKIVLAIMSHEFPIGFGLGLELVKHNSALRHVGLAAAYGVTCPIGIAIGVLISETGNEDSAAVDITTAVLLCVAGGVFLYVAFFQILQGEVTPNMQLYKVVALLLGFMLIATMVQVVPHDHQHEPGEQGHHSQEHEGDHHHHQDHDHGPHTEVHGG